MSTSDPRDADAYAVLGVDRTPMTTPIATAYRRLARRHHPDLAGDGATRRMMHINAAFDAIRTAAAGRLRRSHAAACPRATARVVPDRLPAARRARCSISAACRLVARRDRTRRSRYLIWLAERRGG